MIKAILLLLALTGCASKSPVSALVDTAQQSIQSTQEEISRLDNTLTPECKTEGVQAIIRVLNDRLMIHKEELQNIETVYKTELELKDETNEKLMCVIVILLIALGFSLKKLFT